MREDALVSNDWPDSASMTGGHETMARGEVSADKSHGSGGSSRKYYTQHQQQSSDRKTDIEKLYSDDVSGEKKRSEFNHSNTAAFDEVAWSGKKPSSGHNHHADQKRRSRSGSSAHIAAYHQQQQQQTYQQLEEGSIERFHWNDKIPGDSETQSQVSQTHNIKPSTVKMLASQQARKNKMSGVMREFQNFNDEEKLYWNEKLQYSGQLGSSCVDISAPAPGHSIKSSDMFGPNTLIKPVVGGSVGVGGKGKALAAYRNYLQAHEASSVSGRRINKQMMGAQGGFHKNCKKKIMEFSI